MSSCKVEQLGTMTEGLEAGLPLDRAVLISTGNEHLECEPWGLEFGGVTTDFDADLAGGQLCSPVIGQSFLSR